MSDFPFNPKKWNRHVLLTCAEMRRAEEIVYAQGTPSFSLMQRAGEAIADIVRQKYKSCASFAKATEARRVLVLCGPGNNGGDGFVAAESLRASGWDVSVAAMKVPFPFTGEGGAQSRSDWEGEGGEVKPSPASLRSAPSPAVRERDSDQAAKNWCGKTLPLEAVSFDHADLVVDALFGTGLTKPIEGVARAALEKLAQTKIPIVAVDLPSGINGDTGEILGIAPQAVLTITFFRKKIGHRLLPGAKLCGETIVTDIGIGDDVLDQIKPKACENAAKLWLDQFPFPKAEGNKYTRGNALICGGAAMTGATRLAARTAQRIGAGLVTLAAPESAVAVYAELESVIVRPADTLAAWKELLGDVKRNAILIGPGLGIGKPHADFVLAALETKKSCVLDADALSNFADRPDELFAKLHPHCVLTPHEGEFARLFGKRVDAGKNKLAHARKAAEIAGCIVLLKGADTVIASPDGRAVINVNAPPWLATAGAGDVLAGMILGLLAQHMDECTAGAAAAWIHGDVAAHFGPGLIAEDIVDGIPAALKRLSDTLKGL
jgi:NAD(P)H-hydrate epimerase